MKKKPNNQSLKSKLKSKSKSKSELKIISGIYKSRKIFFEYDINNHIKTSNIKTSNIKTSNIKTCDIKTRDIKIRPTPTRLRETLFNWLMHDIQDSYCIDLFSGSGILGFEAISRGAKAVCAYDTNSQNIKNIKQNCKNLDISSNIYISQNQDCLSLFNNLNNKLDEILNNYKNIIIFCDPPFNTDLLIKCCEIFANMRNNKQDISNTHQILLYIECPVNLNNNQTNALNKLSSNFSLVKQSKCADINGLLFKI